MLYAGLLAKVLCNCLFGSSADKTRMYPANQRELQLTLVLYLIIPNVVWDFFDADVSLFSEYVTVWATLKSQRDD